MDTTTPDVPNVAHTADGIPHGPPPGAPPDARQNAAGVWIDNKGRILAGQPIRKILPQRTRKEQKTPSELVRGKIMRAIRFAGRKLEPNSEDGGSEGWWRMMAEKHPAETLRALIAVTPMPRSVTVEAGASWQELMAQAWQASAGIIDVSPEDVLALPSPTLETASDPEPPDDEHP